MRTLIEFLRANVPENVGRHLWLSVDHQSVLRIHVLNCRIFERDE
jgi:hypothetical protein